MHRTQAYLALASELESWRKVPPEELVALIGTPAVRTEVSLGGEELDIEIAVAWEGFDKRAVRVLGTANGPSSWRLERLQESIVIPLL